MMKGKLREAEREPHGHTVNADRPGISALTLVMFVFTSLFCFLILLFENNTRVILN